MKRTRDDCWEQSKSLTQWSFLHAFELYFFFNLSIDNVFSQPRTSLVLTSISSHLTQASRSVICYFFISTQITLYLAPHFLMLCLQCVICWCFIYVTANSKPNCNYDSKDSCCPRWYKWRWYNLYSALYWRAYETIRTLHWWRFVIPSFYAYKCGCQWCVLLFSYTEINK